MKRLFLVLLAVAVALIADAQVTHTQDGHLLLYGLRLNSTLQQRKQNLVKNGFRYQKMEDGDLIYKGKFRGKPCEVAIIYDRSNGRVTGMTFTFVNHDEGLTENVVKKLESDLGPALERYLRKDQSDVARESLNEGNADEEEISPAYVVQYANRHDETVLFVCFTDSAGGLSFSLGGDGLYESMKEGE